MRLVTFRSDAADAHARLGAVAGDRVFDLARAHAARSGAEPFPATLLELLRGGDRARDIAERALRHARENPDDDTFGYNTASVSFLPPVPRPGKIICLGHNYRQHVLEMGGELPEYPLIFAKFANTLIGHHQPIVLPRVSDKVDYEAEMVIVIGKTGKDIAPEDAFEHIAGYTILNDVSVRDWQRRTAQWLQGKTFDGAGPLGPALVTRDEVPDAQALDISLRLNGAVMQRSNTRDFIFPIPRIIEYLSQIMTLEPGDLIATGTPSGVGSARDPQVFLKPGDVVRIEVEGIGTLENPVVAADGARSG